MATSGEIYTTMFISLHGGAGYANTNRATQYGRHKLSTTPNKREICMEVSQDEWEILNESAQKNKTSIGEILMYTFWGYVRATRQLEELGAALDSGTNKPEADGDSNAGNGDDDQ